MEEDLRDQLQKLQQQHAIYLKQSQGAIHIPSALKRKYPNAATEFAWQYLFPAAKLCTHPRSREVARHHLHEKSLQNQFKKGIEKNQHLQKGILPHLEAFVRHPSS